MDMFSAFKIIFAFFFNQERKSRRIKIFFLLSLIPVLVLLLAKVVELGNPGSRVTAEEVFSRVLLIVYIQLLIPVLALLFGSVIVNEEVDHKTLVFLTTSPIPKPSVVFGKFAAYALISSIIVSIGFILSFIIINLNQFGKMVYAKEFFSFMGVGVLALLAYMGFFTLLGTLMKKSMILGLMFIFGWESIVQYFPGVTQKFTFAHYIKSLLPRSSEGDSFLRFLRARLEASSTAEAIIVLVVFTVAFLALAAYVFKTREYVLSDSV